MIEINRINKIGASLQFRGGQEEPDQDAVVDRPVEQQDLRV